MKYLLRLTLAALCGICGLSVASSLLAGDLAGSRPNIILVLTDDQGYAQLACHGHPWLETPHLDALHARSVSFTDFHVSPTCSPTRSALMTGNHPFKNGVTHTGGGRGRLAPSATTLPQTWQKRATSPAFLANGTWVIRSDVTLPTRDLTNGTGLQTAMTRSIGTNPNYCNG